MPQLVKEQPQLSPSSQAPVLVFTPRSLKTYRKLDHGVRQLFDQLIARIQVNDPRVTWVKFQPQARGLYNNSSLWEAKANRKYRLILSGRVGTVEILDFTHRGEHLFGREF